MELILLISYLPGTTVLHCLMSSVLKNIVPQILHF